MRLLLLVSGICVAIVGLGTRGEAQNYPWCAQYSEAVVPRVASLRLSNNGWPMLAALVGSAYKISTYQPTRSSRRRYPY